MRKYRVILKNGRYIAQARWFGFLWLDLLGLVQWKSRDSLAGAKADIANDIASRKAPRVVYEESAEPKPELYPGSIEDIADLRERGEELRRLAVKVNQPSPRGK